MQALDSHCKCMHRAASYAVALAFLTGLLADHQPYRWSETSAPSEKCEPQLCQQVFIELLCTPCQSAHNQSCQGSCIPRAGNSTSRAVVVVLRPAVHSSRLPCGSSICDLAAAKIRTALAPFLQTVTPTDVERRVVCRSPAGDLKDSCTARREDSITGQRADHSINQQHKTMLYLMMRSVGPLFTGNTGSESPAGDVSRPFDVLQP